MNKRVLILEDEPIIAWDLEEELKSRGWEIAGVASCSTRALQNISDLRPHVAVLDINLGRENSFDVARACLNQDIVVVFLSGDSGQARPDDLRHLALCSKPVDYHKLHVTLKDVTGTD